MEVADYVKITAPTQKGLLYGGISVTQILYQDTNKNTIPNDPRSPFVTSGVRLGTPAVTTRRLKEDDMKVIAKAIRLTLLDKKLDEANELVLGLTEKYPLYE